MDGVELAIRLSWQPCALGYCGPSKAPEAFIRYLSGEGNVEEVRGAIKRFEGLYPYLRLYAEKSGKDILDPAVVEAYWFGNDLSGSCIPADFEGLFDELVSRGLPESLAESLREDLPAGAVPTHAFHVLYVGPGNTTGTVKPTMPVKDKCLITPATVVSVGSNLTVKRRPLVMEDDRLAFGPKETFTAHYLPQMLPDVKVGDTVALHWGFACMVLDDAQEARLGENNQAMVDVVSDYLTDSS